MEIKLTNKDPDGISLEADGRFTGTDMIMIFARMELQKEDFIEKVTKMLDVPPSTAKAKVELDIERAKKFLEETTEYSEAEIAFLEEK